MPIYGTSNMRTQRRNIQKGNTPHFRSRTGHGWQIRSRDWRTVDLKVQIRPNLGDVLFQFVQLFRLGQTDSDTVRSNLYFLCENYIVS